MSAFVNEQEIRDTPLSELRVHPKNKRKGDLAGLGESYEVNGFYGTIVAQKSTGYVLVGNHRFMRAVEDGIASLPVAWLDCDDEKAKRILLVDNRLNDKASYDDKGLAELLSEMSNTSGLKGTGFDEGDLEQLIRGLDPGFSPAGEDDQGRLDRKAMVVCPECGHEFTSS